MKPFGKLSPDDKLSASLMPMLFDRPHKVLAKLRSAINNEVTPETVDIKVQERMDMGNVLEETIANLVQERLNITLKYPVEDVMSKEIGMTADRKHLDIYASLDAIFYANKPKVVVPEDRRIFTENNEQINLLGPVPVEIKNMQYKPYDSIDCMTVEYGRGFLQLQAQMMVAEAKFGIIGCLFNGNDLRLFVLKENKQLQEEIIDKALTLYEHLERGTDYDPADIEAMTEKYADIKKANVVLDENMLDDVHEYEECLNTRKEIDKKIDDLQMKMIDKLGDAEVGIIHHNGGMTRLSRPYRHYKAQPPKYIEAKEARNVRAKSVSIKHLTDEWT